MRRFLSLLLAATAWPWASAQAAPDGSADDRLAALKWKARPVVILADSAGDPRVARQVAALDHARAAVGDRDIEVLQETVPHGVLRRRLGVAERGFIVVLVGKDGGVKQVWHAPVDPQQIFKVIDAMPMRQHEMKG